MIGYGDMATAVLALLALIALRKQLPYAIALVWVCVTVGMLDTGERDHPIHPLQRVHVSARRWSVKDLDPVSEEACTRCGRDDDQRRAADPRGDLRPPDFHQSR